MVGTSSILDPVDSTKRLGIAAVLVAALLLAAVPGAGALAAVKCDPWAGGIGAYGGWKNGGARSGECAGGTYVMETALGRTDSASTGTVTAWSAYGTSDVSWDGATGGAGTTVIVGTTAAGHAAGVGAAWDAAARSGCVSASVAGVEVACLGP